MPEAGKEPAPDDAVVIGAPGTAAEAARAHALVRRPAPTARHAHRADQPSSTPDVHEPLPSFGRAGHGPPRVVGSTACAAPPPRRGADVVPLVINAVGPADILDATPARGVDTALLAPLPALFRDRIDRGHGAASVSRAVESRRGAA